MLNIPFGKTLIKGFQKITGPQAHTFWEYVRIFHLADRINFLGHNIIFVYLYFIFISGSKPLILFVPNMLFLEIISLLKNMFTNYNFSRNLNIYLDIAYKIIGHLCLQESGFHNGFHLHIYT